MFWIGQKVCAWADLVVGEVVEIVDDLVVVRFVGRRRVYTVAFEPYQLVTVH